MLPHCIIYLIISDVKLLFMCLLALCMCSLKKKVYLDLLPIFDWVCLVFDIELHELFILEMHPFSAASFANIFSHSVAFPFVLLMVSFAVQKLLSLEHHLTPHTKMNSKWIKNLIFKTRYYKTLGGKHRHKSQQDFS